MNILTRFGISHSRLTVLVMIGLIMQGLISYSGLSKREDPSITIRTVVVSAQYSGMSPERMEALIAEPIERKAREIAEIDEIKTLITTGSSVINLEIHSWVPNAKIAEIKQDIRNKMKDVESELPSGTRGPFVNTDYGSVTVVSVAVTGEGYNYAELSDAAEELRDHIYTLDGVGKVNLYGEQDERIYLEIDSRKLAAVGVEIQQVLTDLESQNVILPAGEVDAGGIALVLEANGDLKDVESIRRVLTKISGLAGFVRLQDLVSVRRGYVDPMDKPVYFDGQPAVMVAVEMSEGEDIQVVGKRIRAAIEKHEDTQPIGIAYNFATYQETKVTDSINNALSNVAQTFGVVFIVMLVFLGLRAAFIIACIVPFTVMFALMGMLQLGVELQQVSIAAVIISLGLLVDNGLVVVEDIQARMGQGIEPKQAAEEAGSQFTIPLGVASVTTVSAFIPLLILDGTSGEYAFSLGAVVGVMLLGSWITALYILPALTVWLSGRQKTKENTQPNLLVRSYGTLIRRTLSVSLLVIPLSYVLVAYAVTLFGPLKKEMFPLSARNQFLIYQDMPKGTAISATNAEALAVQKWLSDKSVNPEVADVTTYVGSGGPRFYLALSPADTNPATAFFLINTDDFDGAVAASDRAQKYLLENHPAARFKIKRLAMGGSESGIVKIKISGPDGDKLLSLAHQVEAGFADAPGLVQNENDWGNKSLKMVINVAQDKARELGVSSQSISNVMDAYFSGTEISQFREGNDSIPIVVRAEKPFRDSLEDLANLSVTASGQLVSLDRVASLAPKLEFSQMRRQNQKRMIIVSAKSNMLSAEKLLALNLETINNLDPGPEYLVEIAGETADSSEVNEDLAAGVPLALMVMLFALMFQFNSARRVILTFMTIPLIVIGAPMALLLTDRPLSFFAILGMISLAGIIINNAIVLIDQIDIERETMELRDAIVEASQKRLTPIMLTSLTTVFGLMPMAIAGGALFEPMAALMIGGLAVGSVLTLFFVPCGYYLFFRSYRRKADDGENLAGEPDAAEAVAG
ncbi:MAG: efflux RND transporter permease subunit [Rhizobiaceae bacterium]